MLDPTRTYSFVLAVMDFFGKKPEQSTMEFAAEIKALTEGDRSDLKAMLQELGYRVT